MKKGWKKIFGIVALCTMMATSTTTVCAAGAIEINRDVSLTINYENSGQKIEGARFDVYKVADVDAYGQLTLTERFSGYPIQFNGNNQDSWDVLATTLKGYVWTDSLESDAAGETNTLGKMELELKPGMYLVVGSRRTVGEMTYSAVPFLIQLPGRSEEANIWDYEVSVYPKSEGEKNPPDDPDDRLLTRKVLKIWDDEGKEGRRPKEITVHLMCDGKVYDTQKLNVENNWRYVWDNLDRNHEWLVTEDAVSNYTQAITQEGITFTVKNTVKPEVPASPKEPGTTSLHKTGLLWWPIGVLVAIGLLCIVIGLIRRKGAKDE